MSNHASLEDRRRYQRNWLAKNPDYMRAYLSTPKWVAYQKEYQAKRRAERIASRPAPEPCSCGNSQSFEWAANRWHCVPCRRLRSRQNEAEHKNASIRRRHVRRKAARLEAKYGAPIATAFLSLVQRGCHGIQWWHIIRRALPLHLHKLGKNAIRRIEVLNLLQNRPMWNVGWECQLCDVHNEDDRFFDVDHVVPRSRGGGNSLKNLQVLCPNCHRSKTISDLHQKRNSGAAACAQEEAKSVLTDGQSPLVKLTLTREPESSGQNGCLFRDDPVNGNRAVSAAA